MISFFLSALLFQIPFAMAVEKAPQQVLAVTTQQLTAAPCKAPLPTDDSITRYLGQVEDGQVRRGIFEMARTSYWLKRKSGVTFAGEKKRLVDAFEFLVSRDRTIQDKYKINPECEKVLCAVDKIWGAKLGRRILYIKVKFGFNSSELANKNSQRLTIQMADHIIAALEDLPPHFARLARGGNQRLVLLVPGVNFTTITKAGADASINIYPAMLEHPLHTWQTTLYHELAHNIAHRQGLRKNQAWVKAAGWKTSIFGPAADPSARCSLSDYGKTNSAEDFAETASSYRYRGPDLKRYCPLKYEFMREKVYNGIEYLNNSTCKISSKAHVQL